MSIPTQKTDKEVAILDATLKLISERGFHNTPMSLIAQRSGVSAGIIYHYFDNKDALIHELYKDIKRRHAKALVQGNPQELAWEDFFVQMWLNAYQFYISHPEETKFLEQYENSPFAKTWDEQSIAADGDETTIMIMEQIQHMIEVGIVRNMPLIVLHDLTFSVALNIAKRQINETVNLDEASLIGIAQACRRAIEVE